MSASAPLPLLHRYARWLLLALALVLGVAVLPGGTASAAAPPVVQCSGLLNQGGQAVECTVTVVNTLDAATGVGSSVVTVQQCTGPAGATTCSAPVTSTSADVVTTVSQCNGSASGGGGTVTCSVSITNDITGGAAPTAATVNQCVGSGDGSGTVACTPVGSTTGATVTQCNGSGNGGGSTVRCTVTAGSTQSSSLPITVDQCNGSANGGGSLVTCRTSITNNALAAPVASPSASPSTSPSPSASPSASQSSSASPSTSPSASASASRSPSPAPTGVAPRPSTSPAAVPTAAATPAAPPVPVQPDAPAPPDSGVLPDVLEPGVVVPAAGTPVTVTGSLPVTGAALVPLVLLGLLVCAAGALLLLATRRPHGRHVLR